MASSDVGGVAGWVVDVINTIGEVGVGALIASASRGDINPVLTWVAATIGALVGAYVLYAVGALVGHDRLHELAGKRWFVLFSRSDLARGERFFKDHAAKWCCRVDASHLCARSSRYPPGSPRCRCGASQH